MFLEIKGRAKKGGMEHDLEKKIRKCLCDEPRPGKPSRITAEQYCQVLDVALEFPALSSRPVSQ